MLKPFWSRLAVSVALALFLVLAPRPVLGEGEPAAAEQIASVDQLKALAFRAVLENRFDHADELLTKAGSMAADDPAVLQMFGWIEQFEKQRREFFAERKKQYDKAVANVRLLREQGLANYAIDEAAKAYLLAEDKKAFRQEPWVNELIATTAAMANDFEQNEQWLKAQPLYVGLASIEPANAEWKERLNQATRRIRLIILYTPDELRVMQKAAVEERARVDALLNPTTKPAKPLPDEVNDSFRVDWRETLSGIDGDMLWDALVEARDNYYKSIDYRDLMLGGLKGVEALLTTRGLEKEFPGLADEAARSAMLGEISAKRDAAQNAAPAVQKILLRQALADLKNRNAVTTKLPEEVLISEFADGAFAELDPFSGMIWPSDLSEFNKSTQGEFTGVGIQIQKGDDGGLKVISPMEDAPAYKAGIKAGDTITHINGKNAHGISLNQAVKAITGPSGTTVTLTIRSPLGDVKDYTLERQMVKVASVKGWSHRPGGGWDYLIDPDNHIAYLRLTSFTKSTPDELGSAMREMRDAGARGLILDLRHNPGGLLQAATAVSDKFLSDGRIVSTRAERNTGNPDTEMRAEDQADDETELPTVVLVNQYSASASEIVSGALKDHERALLVGERTYGKGSVQMLFQLGNRKALLKLTTSHYYLPKGKCIHREENSQEWGVDPNLVIEMTPEQMRAASDARQELDVLRDANAPPAEDEHRKLQDIAPAVQDAVAAVKPKDPLASDAQLSAALLLVRMQLAGAHL